MLRSTTGIGGKPQPWPLIAKERSRAFAAGRDGNQSSRTHGKIEHQSKSRRSASAILPLSVSPLLRHSAAEEIMIQGTGKDVSASATGKLIALVYGLVSYAVFFATFLYAIGFVSGFLVPKAIDSGTAVPIVEACIVDVLLMSLFAVQHSGMARRPFKEWWARYVPTAVERTTYVLLASLSLLLLFWQWRPIPAVVWQIEDARFAMAVTALSHLGWLIVLTSTFLISHFELFGLQQVANNLLDRPSPAPHFRTPLLYRFVRHPIYLGFVIAFWSTPRMTAGHLLFAGVTTAYIILAIQLEERDLIAAFGDDYRRYRERVSMLVPWRRSN